MTQTITISTAIAYPNAAPHLGHALEFIQADALARFYRLSGFDVMFTTGTDEHGTKIYKTAKEENMTPQELVDRNVEYFKEMCDILGISNDLFLRTTDEVLRRGAVKLWERLVAAGDLYKDTYEGLYCSGCENYMLKKDLVDGKCPNHMKEPEVLKEENYFFRLSKYIPWLKEHIGGQLEVLGEFRVAEIKNMLDDLKDVSFSRPKSALPWGVTVPGDSDHVMYVWCDALANYLTGLDFAGEGIDGVGADGVVCGENFKKYWPTTINIIGKDIMKFHAIFWPAMLKSAELPLPEKLYVHGFVTSEGKKMGKSLGNVVDPVEYAREFGADALRYYLLSQISTQDDGDFARDRFLEVYQAHLANNVGNLVSRVVAMVEKYRDGVINLNDGLYDEEASGFFEKEYVNNLFRSVFLQYNSDFENFDIKRASEAVLEIAHNMNEFIEAKKPWGLAKNGDDNDLNFVLFTLLEGIRVIGVLLQPIIPIKANEILDQLGIGLEDRNFDSIFDSQYKFLCRKRYKVEKGEPLFPRLEV